MAEWFKRRLQAIEGNIVYTLLAALGVYLLTLLPFATVKLWLSKPVSNLSMVLWSLLPAAFFFAVLLVSRIRNPAIHFQVCPTSGPSQSISLIVKNLGRTTTFSAFCEIVDHPNGSNDYRKGEFRCGWGDGSAEQRLLPKDETSTILIAAFSRPAHMDDILQADLLEVLGQNAKRWDTFRWQEYPDGRLPAFILRIRLVAERTRKPKVLLYTLKPCGYLGPLEMVVHEDQG
jgi:hypothetical protein